MPVIHGGEPVAAAEVALRNDEGLGVVGGYESETNGGETSQGGKFKRGKPGEDGNSEQGGIGGNGGNNDGEAKVERVVPVLDLSLM